jgi:hypothetical protein
LRLVREQRCTALNAPFLSLSIGNVAPIPLLGKRMAGPRKTRKSIREPRVKSSFSPAQIVWTPICRWVQSLGPYVSLCVVVVPLAIVEPLKLVAAVVAGSGHWVTGTVTIACAYAVSLFFVERLFVIAKPKLLMLPWFAAGWKWFVAVRSKTLALIKWPFAGADRTALQRKR